MRLRFLALVAVSLALVALMGGVAYADTASDNAQCLTCHGVSGSGSSLRTDFAVGDVSYTACAACHSRYKHFEHPGVPTPCTNCHLGAQVGAPYYYSDTTTPYGYFSDSTYASKTPEQLHAIHANGNWVATYFRPVLGCRNCHAGAACSACHTSAVAHTDHALPDYPAVTYTVATGAATLSTSSTCVNESCHALAQASTAEFVPACSTCHFTFAEHYDTVAHTSSTLVGCSGEGCHSTPDLLSVHTQRNAEFGCGGCHDSVRADVQSSIAEGLTGCSDCHGSISALTGHRDAHAANPPLANADGTPNYSYYTGSVGSAPTGDCKGCHTSNLVDEHLGLYYGSWVLFPRHDSTGAALTCGTCHDQPEGSTVQDAIAACKSACESCHTVHGPMQAVHTSTFVDGATIPCADCHSANLADEHNGGYTNTAGLTGCDVCHELYEGMTSGSVTGSATQAAISITNDTRCSACHTTYHTNTAAHQATTDASKACAVCHTEGGADLVDVTAIHADAALGACRVCHANTTRVPDISAKTAECASCHATQGTDYHAGMASGHTYSDMGESCKSCHAQTLPEAHADYLDRYPAYGDTCALCHKNADPDRIDWTTASADCSSCHEIHGDVEVLHTATESEGCVRCHDSADVRLVHATTTGDPGTSCDVCHNATFELTADMTAECETCHKDGGVPFHTAMNVRHIGLGTSGTCEGAACHVRDVATLHEEFIGPGTQFPQYEDSCALCHLNEDATRIDWTLATNGTCYNCHGDPHDRMNHVASSANSQDCFGCHNSWVPDTHKANPPSNGTYDNCNTCHRNPLAGNLTWDKATSDCEGCHDKYPSAANHYPADKHLAVHTDVCVDCHYMDLKSEHAKAAVTCVECHTDPSDSAVIAAGWNKNCNQCHMDMHDDKPTRHASTRADCSTSGCHESDVSAIHGNLGWLGCKTCHTGPAQLASDLTKNCTDSGCHGDGYHAGLPGLHTATASSDCTRCHSQALPDGSQLEPIHGGVCATCHNTTIDASTKTAECTTCHNTTVSPYHGQMDALHTFGAMDSGCQTAGCHVKTLPEEHAKYLSRYPAYSDTCALCHLNADPARIDWTTASADCMTCHDGHGDITTIHTATASQACADCHETQNTLGIHLKKDGSGDTDCGVCHNAPAGRINWDTATIECTSCHGTYSQIDPNHYPLAAHDATAQTGCNQCHYMDMKAEHFKPTVAVSCVTCHETKVDSFTAAWDKTCAACHPTNHGDRNAKHVSTNATCGGAGCHNITDVSDIHKSLAGSGCGVCHKDPASPATTTDCTASGCHAGVGTDHKGLHDASSVNPNGCTGCHFMNLVDEHAALGYTCDTCHKSTASGVVAAIAANDLRCKSCHPTMHSKQDWEFNPNMAGGHRVSESLPAMRSVFVINGTKYTWTLPAASSFLKSGWTTSSVMSCDSCHSYTGATGPHGATMKVNIDPAYPTSWKTAYLRDGTTLGMSSNTVICAKCHDLNGTGSTFSNKVHDTGDHHDSRDGLCINCHVQVPHGWGRPRLLGYTTDAAPYTTAASGLQQLALRSYTPTNWSKGDCYARCAGDHSHTVSNVWPADSGPVPTTGDVSGTVTKSTGGAIAGAMVSIAGKSATTGTTGTYSITAIPAGTYTMTVSASGYNTWSGSVTITAAGTATQNVSLTPVVTTGSVSGTVTKADGAALAGATVSIAGKTATTASNGTYSVTGIAAGTYTMTVSATGYANWSGSVVITAGGTTTQNVTLTAVSTPTNLARTGASTASSQYSSTYGAAQATDGNTSTYWRSSSTGNQWLRSDLGSAKTITSVVVNWTSSYYARSYRIETSNDGTNWTQQYSTTSGNGSIDTITIPSVSARYVRVYCTSSNGSSYRITEFEVWGY